MRSFKKKGGSVRKIALNNLKQIKIKQNHIQGPMRGFPKMKNLIGLGFSEILKDKQIKYEKTVFIKPVKFSVQIPYFSNFIFVNSDF